MSQTARRRRPYAARVPMEERREQLLDAALRVIDRDGYGGVSIESIAREAGVTRPVVYGAYDGLGDLLMSLLDRQQARALAQLMSAIPLDVDRSDLLDAVDQAVRSLFTMVTEDPMTWRPILAARPAVPDLVQQRIAGDWERVRSLIAGVIDSAFNTRGAPAVDADIASHAVMAVLEHFGRLVLEEPGTLDVDRMAATARAVLAAFLR